MRQGLSIQHESLASLHRIVDVKVLHAQDILVDVEGMQVPINVISHEVNLRRASDGPYHGTQGFDGSFVREHVANGFGNGIAEAMRVIGHLVIVILLRVQLLELFDRRLVFEALAFTQTRPQTVTRENSLEEASCRN